MKKTTVLLAGLAVAGAGIALRSGRENVRLRAELAQLRAESPPRPEAAPPPPGPAAVVRPAAPVPDPVAAADRALAEGRRRWNEPAARAQRFAAAVLRVERTYGRWLQRLNLPPEKLEALKRQLAANALAMADATLPDTASMDEAQAAALLRTMQRTSADNEGRLRALLGPDAYAQLDAFEKAEAYRDAVTPLANAMRADGLPVDDTLEDAMLAAYATAFRRATEQAVAAAPADPARLPEAERQALKRQQVEALHRELLRQLSTVLTTDQLDAFMQAQLESESLP